MASLEDVLKGGSTEPEEQQAETQANESQVEQPQGETEQQPAAAEGAPPAPDAEDDTPLPVHVVKAIRGELKAAKGERNDWKEKAISAQAKLEERDRMDQQRQRQAGQQPPSDAPQLSPQEFIAAQMFNERCNTSEMILRSKHEDVDEKVAVFMDAAQKNPALGAELHRQTHPYQFAYDWARKEMARREIGEDPDAYRKQLEDKIRAELSQSSAAPAPAATRAPLPPASLATARSAAPRSAPAWSGPTPLNEILTRG